MTSILSHFPTIPATLKRPTGADVDGNWVEGATVESPILVVPPQPANGADLQFLPDGEREYVHKKCWTESDLLLEDVLEINGAEYKVVLVGDYDESCLNWGFDGFHRVLIREVQ
jgi:hypothetical protein